MRFTEKAVSKKRLPRIGLLIAVAVMVSSCNGGIDSVFPKAERPVSEKIVKKMKSKGMAQSSPILIRIYKEEDVLEVWKQKDTGRYALLESFEICKWSGVLGPKFKEGDRQAPEGFYNVGKAQLNPNSDFYLSFNIGFPNRYDRSHGRTGTHLMVHGACSSAGCYSMTDEQIAEIYAMARDSINGGQDYFQVQAFPFRMTAENMAKNVTNPHFEFWKMLKEGYDHFELTNYPPKVDVCEKRYLFNREAVDGQDFRSSEACPPVTMPKRLIELYSEKRKAEKADFSKALKREQARAKFKGEALASLDISQFSIIAAGSEVLPPPTPEAPPVVETAPETAAEPALVSAATPTTQPAKSEPGAAEIQAAAASPIDGVVSGTQNEALLRGEDVIANDGAAPSEEQVSANAAVDAEPDSVTADPGVAQSVDSAGIPIPQPAQRQAAAAAVEPEKKKPWWARKKPVGDK
jgi:murein L,D-transpeptidase YafK